MSSSTVFPPGGMRFEVLPAPSSSVPSSDSSDAAKTPEQLRATGPTSDLVARATRETAAFSDDQRQFQAVQQTQEVERLANVAAWRVARSAAQESRLQKIVPLLTSCGLGFGAGLIFGWGFYLWRNRVAA